MNKVILMGRLTRDPEVRYGQSGQQTAVCRYSLAVNRSYKREGKLICAHISHLVGFGNSITGSLKGDAIIHVIAMIYRDVL